MNNFIFTVNGGEVKGQLRGSMTDQETYIDDKEPETLYIDVTDKNYNRVMISVFLMEDNTKQKDKDSLYAMDVINIPKNLCGEEALKDFGLTSNLALEQAMVKENIYDIFNKIMNQKSLNL